MSHDAGLPERYVLCLDDDRDFLKSLEVFLPDQINGGASGVTYHFAFLQDPIEALSTLSELIGEGSVVAMIISDQQMPAMKGSEFLLKAREISEASIRILLTGHAGIEAAISAINERLLDRYLTKPIEDHHDFGMNVHQLLQRFEMSRMIETQAATLRTLYEFANRINTLDNLHGMLDYVARFSREALGCDDVLVEATDGAGRICIARSGASAVGAGVSELPADASLTMATVEGPSTGRLGAEAARSELGVMLSRHGIRAETPASFARLRSGSNPMGTVIAARASGAFSDQELKILGYIADTASIALQKQHTWMRLEEAYQVTKEQAGHLEEANRRLQLLDRMKSDFLRFISHELRTPLSYMSAVAMLEGESQASDHGEIATIVRKGYERLVRFIDLGLDYVDWCGMGRIQATERTDLREVAAAASDALGQRVERKVEMCAELPGKACMIAMRQATAEELVGVLLDNAVKFSPETPTVRLELQSLGNDVTLRVSDQGRGFPPEIATTIFDPFTVMDTMHHHEGSALNLARMRAMVEAHGGTVSAESPGPGRGATFTIRLPAADSGAAAKPSDTDGDRPNRESRAA